MIFMQIKHLLCVTPVGLESWRAWLSLVLRERLLFTVNHYTVALKVQALLCLGGEELWSEADSSCSGQPIHLWQFLRELLLKPHNYGRCIRWLNKEKGIFIVFNGTDRHAATGSFKTRKSALKGHFVNVALFLEDETN